jgi:nucleotide-binding universal stress UspA family protein
MSSPAAACTGTSRSSTRPSSPRPVLVGIDGSITDTWAVRAAALEAAAGRSRLVFVSIAGRAGMAYCLRQAHRIVAATAPGVSVDEVEDHAAAGALVELSTQAAAVVVGRPDQLGLEGLVAASVAHQVATYAECPVLVVPDPAEPVEARRPGQARTSGLGVVLGVDAGESAEAAVGFAFDHSARRGLPLTAVRACAPLPDAHRGGVIPDQFHAAEDRFLSEALAGWCEKYPDVSVSRQNHDWHAARILVEASRIADLVVVGARGSGGFDNLRLGSVSEAVMRHAWCTVAIVR